MSMSFSFPSSGAESLLEGLNPEQRAAVTLPSGHALVLAGAGSGKTKVLTTRIAWLLQTQGLGPEAILAVTFTNKAAKEMASRLSALVPGVLRGMWLGTFHGLCHRLLRTHAALAGLPTTFQVLDKQDQLSAVKRLCKALQLDPELHPPKNLQSFIGHCKEQGWRPEQVPVRDPNQAQKVDFYRQYQAQCAREGVVDFGELMLRSYELLRDQDGLRHHYQQRFRHLLVDEFQDTNALQYAWLKLLAGEVSAQGFVSAGNAVLAVGDDDQSIYAFRGARVDNMADFLREFAVAAPIKLEQNYRSAGHILATANALIAHNQVRLGKQLRTARDPGEPVRVYRAPSDLAEAEAVLQHIQERLAAGTPPSEMAVLYRSNAQSRVLETALVRAGVAYRVYGGVRFFERAEIKNALAYLRLLLHPDDDTSWLRVVNFPPRGIGVRTVEQWQDVARAHALPLEQAVSLLKGTVASKVTGVVAKLEVLREMLPHRSLLDMVRLTLEHTGLLAHYQAEREGQERLDNLLELLNAASTVVGTELGEASTPQALADFLTHAALESGEPLADTTQEAIQLMTVHAAKGLEFDTVFVTGLEESLFPHENSAHHLAGLEEERRLMYVALTRARHRLYLSHADSRMLHGQTRSHFPSRFLGELPGSSLKWIGRGGLPAGSAPASTPARHDSAWRVGMGVFHSKFGEGRLLALEGQGNEAKAQVDFLRHGTKWLVLAIAKLTPL